MNQKPLKPQLHMRRSDLDDLPRPVLPEGYSIRSYRPGDGARWSRIIADSFGGDIGDWDFDLIMRCKDLFRPESIFFIVAGRQAVATASAYCRPAFMPDFGMLHFVAVTPGHTGLRLGRQICLAALRRMREDGRRGAWLSTDDFRLPAIKTYLNLGFEPLLVHENQSKRWCDVFRSLGAPELCRRFDPILSGALWRSPVPSRDDFDDGAGDH